MQRLRLVVAMVSLAMPVHVSSQSIGIYADIEATDTEICIPVGVPVRAFLVFRETDSPGIVGFEFRVVGLPSSWFAFDEYCGPILCPPGGSLFGSGAAWAWSTCKTGDLVILGTELIIATDPRPSVAFQIAGRVPPSHPGFDCALVIRCDAPVYTFECVSGNTTMVRQDDCPVAVRHHSWSAIKTLYE